MIQLVLSVLLSIQDPVKRFFFYFIYVCVCVSLCVHMHADAFEGQKGALYSLELVIGVVTYQLEQISNSLQKQSTLEPGGGGHAFNTSTKEIEAGGSL